MMALNLYYQAMLMVGRVVEAMPSWAIKQTRNLEDFGCEY